MRLIFIFLSTIAFSGCFYQTENGITFGKPDYEKRNIDVTENDLRILNRTDQLLLEEVWVKNLKTTCADSVQLDLYCALEKASIEVNGVYNHRQPALQEVRFAIDDHYKFYWSKHRLSDFNDNKSTKFPDVKKVLEVATSSVRSKLMHNK